LQIAVKFIVWCLSILISHLYLLVLAQKLWLAGDPLICGLTFNLFIIFLLSIVYLNQKETKSKVNGMISTCFYCVH